MYFVPNEALQRFTAHSNMYFVKIIQIFITLGHLVHSNSNRDQVRNFLATVCDKFLERTRCYICKYKCMCACDYALV